MRALAICMVVACFAGTTAAQKAGDSRAQDEKSAVEATARGFEEAVEKFDREQVNSFLMPDARWIEYGLPVKFDEEWKLIDRLKASGIRIAYRLGDFETHVQGDVAWVTLTIDGTFTRGSAEGQKVPNGQAEVSCFESAASPCESRMTFVESEVLVKTKDGWKIALGHTSALPKAQK